MDLQPSMTTKPRKRLHSAICSDTSYHLERRCVRATSLTKHFQFSRDLLSCIPSSFVKLAENAFWHDKVPMKQLWSDRDGVVTVLELLLDGLWWPNAWLDEIHLPLFRKRVVGDLYSYEHCEFYDKYSSSKPYFPATWEVCSLAIKIDSLNCFQSVNLWQDWFGYKWSNEEKSLH